LALEVDAHLARVAAGTGADAVDIVQRAQRLLQGDGHQPFDFFRGSIIVLDPGSNSRGGNAWVLFHRQAVECDDADDERAEGDHRGGYGALEREGRK